MSAQPRSHQAQVVKISFDTMQSNPNKHIRELSALGGASAQKGRAVPVSVTPIAKQTEKHNVCGFLAVRSPRYRERVFLGMWLLMASVTASLKLLFRSEHQAGTLWSCCLQS